MARHSPDCWLLLTFTVDHWGYAKQKSLLNLGDSFYQNPSIFIVYEYIMRETRAVHNLSLDACHDVKLYQREMPREFKLCGTLG